MLEILFRSSKVSLYGRIVFVYVEMAEHDVISWHGDSMSAEVDRHYISIRGAWFKVSRGADVLFPL